MSSFKKFSSKKRVEALSYTVLFRISGLTSLWVLEEWNTYPFWAWLAESDWDLNGKILTGIFRGIVLRIILDDWTLDWVFGDRMSDWVFVWTWLIGVVSGMLK